MKNDILLPLRRLHGLLHDRTQKYQTVVRLLIKSRLQNPNAVFLVLTPTHGNLGDHAIAVAEQKMLSELGIQHIEVPERELWQLAQLNMLKILNGRSILINGGGNLGTLWPDVEELTRRVIIENPMSAIVIFPNTIYYDDTPSGREEREKSKEIYDAHKNLYLFAREKASYDMMRQLYRNVKLVPDMVLSLGKTGERQQRNGCLLCLRNDREKTRTNEQETIVFQQATCLFGENVRYTDMYVNRRIPIESRKMELSQKFNEFREASLVITDRLHGMIFCAITETPCIVINSKSPKVRGCYEWIKNLDYIRFADDPTQISQLYQQMSQGTHTFDNSHLTLYYDELKNDLRNITRKRK